MSAGTKCSYIPQEYQAIIKGVFGGHTHTEASTTASLYTQVPAITQEAQVTGYWVATVTADAPEIIVSGSMLFVYSNNPAHQVPNASSWHARTADRN